MAPLEVARPWAACHTSSCIWPPRSVAFLSPQLQQQQTRLMKINHDLRHRITVVEAQGKSLIEQKVELEAELQSKEQEMGSLRVELGKLRERLQGEHSQNGEEEPEVSGKPAAEATGRGRQGRGPAPGCKPPCFLHCT